MIVQEKGEGHGDPTMAEIERDYPELLAALRASMGTMTFAEFTERLASGLELYRAALSGRRMGMSEPVARHLARRGDDVEAWLKGWRDSQRDFAEVSLTIDDMLDDYRLHADTGTPLDAEVEEHG